MPTDTMYVKSRWPIWVKDSGIAGLSKNEASDNLSILLPSEDPKCWLNSGHPFSIFITITLPPSECSLSRLEHNPGTFPPLKS